MLHSEKSNKFALHILLIFVFYTTVCADFQQKSGNFTFYSQPEDSLIVHQLMQFITRAQHKYEQLLHFRLQTSVDIYLTASEEDYLTKNPQVVPAWSAGVAYVKRGKIFLKPGTYFDPQEYRQTLYHELFHIYLDQFMKGVDIPVWLNEGLAMNLSGKTLSWQEQIILGNAVYANNFPDLAAIDSILVFRQRQAEIAYLQSFAAVQYLVSTYTEAEIVNMLRSYAKTGSLDRAFKESFAADYFEFEINFYRHLKEQYRWIFFLQFEYLFWIILVIIIVIVFIMRKIHTQRIYQKWEQEDMS